MAGTTAERVRGAWARFDGAWLAEVTLQVGFVGVLGAVLVATATSAGTLLDGWRVASLLLLLGVAAVARRYAFEAAGGEAGAEARSEDDGVRTLLRDADVRFFAFLGAAALLLQVLVQSSTPGVLWGVDRTLALVVTGLALAIVLVGPPLGREIRGSRWLAVGAFAVLATILLYHTLAVPASARASRWPLWAVVAGGVSLLLVPRFVSARAFFWGLALWSAAVALVGAVAAATGEFALWAFDVGVVTGGSDTRGWTGLPRTRSIFRNPNGLGLVTFAGVTAAAVELHRAARARRWAIATVAAGLGGASAVGLLLSHSRASWLAATVAVGCYLGYVALGRWSVPYVTLAGALGTVAAVVLVARGVLGIGDGVERIDLWRASLEAARASPSLLGEGHVSTSRLIEPYLDGEGSTTTHSSYLSVLLRAGIVGALAYVALVVGTIADGARRRGTVDLGALVLAVGWAVHQAFEAYTVLQWTPPAVLAALSLGYVAFGRRPDDGGDSGPADASTPTDASKPPHAGKPPDVSEDPDASTGGTSGTTRAAPDERGRSSGTGSGTRSGTSQSRGGSNSSDASDGAGAPQSDGGRAERSGDGQAPASYEDR